ncbi:hypothetical protein P3L10_007409 [Capsicum annuum]|uniref:uncharacterized protein LOC107861493 n=1 Tax=Capsicum annuum TaxID=4072 RepID=UPI0007BF209C|nr:uncharacterized protein LOC107861493 [Capsicum annuum]
MRIDKLLEELCCHGLKMGGMNSRTTEREEILCLSFPLKHSSSNRNKQSISNLLFHETVATTQQRARFQDIISEPAGGGVVQVRPSFHIHSLGEFFYIPVRRQSDSPHAIYLRPSDPWIYNELTEFARDYPNLIVLPPLDYPNLVPITNNLLKRIIAGIHKHRLWLMSILFSVTLGVCWPI